MMAGRSARGERGAVRIDPRLLIGLLLIAGSTAGVWALVAGLDDAHDVLVARETLTPGTVLDMDDLVVESVRLGATTTRYLSPDVVEGDRLVIVRTVGEGELLPLEAVADRDSTGLATVVVPSRGRLAGELEPGARVDVWTARLVDRGTYEPPAVLVAGAEIAAIVEDDGVVADETTSVELLIPREKVAAMLESLAAQDAIDLVPARAGAAD